MIGNIYRWPLANIISGDGLLVSPSGLTSEICGPLAFSASSQHVHRFNSGRRGRVTSVITPSRETYKGVFAFLLPTFNCPVLVALQARQYRTVTLSPCPSGLTNARKNAYHSSIATVKRGATDGDARRAGRRIRAASQRTCQPQATCIPVAN